MPMYQPRSCAWTVPRPSMIDTAAVVRHSFLTTMEFPLGYFLLSCDIASLRMNGSVIGARAWASYFRSLGHQPSVATTVQWCPLLPWLGTWGAHAAVSRQLSGSLSSQQCPVLPR